jgi:alpha-L-fucosidase
LGVRILAKSAVGFSAAVCIGAVWHPAVGAQARPATERTNVLAQWESLKYGMFIHYGLATFTEDEFGHKDSPASAYAPTALDVDQWIRTAKAAGMKYAVLTAKHCTGHCLWDSALTDYDVAAGADKTDVIAAFVRACRKHGIKPGFYYLLGWDSHHQPRMTPTEYESFCTGQIEELLTRYGPVAELWLDIPWDLGPDTEQALARIYERVKSLQPDCLVLLNQGFDDGSSVSERPPTYRGAEVGPAPIPLWPKDLMDGECTLPPPSGHNPKIVFQKETYYLPMEVCDKLSQHWFWFPDDPLRDVRSLYRLYRDSTARGANLLLDVAPDRRGLIPDASVERLMELKAVIEDPSRLPVDLAAGKPAAASNVYRGEAAWSAAKAVDDDSGTRWATDEDVKECWLQVDLGKPCEFDSAFIREGWGRVRSFVLEYRTGPGDWKVFYEGKSIGDAGITLLFAPVTAQVIRLHILDAALGPTIWDFELLKRPLTAAH